MSANKCCKTVGWDVLYNEHFECGKPGKVERDGKWYCGIHNPERAEVRQAERNAKYEKDRALTSARWEVSRLEKRVVENVLDTYEPLPPFLRALRSELRAAKAKVAELEAQA